MRTFFDSHIALRQPPFQLLDCTISYLRFRTLDAHSIIRKSYTRQLHLQYDHRQLRDESCVIIPIALHNTVSVMRHVLVPHQYTDRA